MNTVENIMSLEEKIKQVWNDDTGRLWAKQASELNICNELIKLELAKPELDIGSSEYCILKTNRTLSFGGAIPSELWWDNFAGAMPNFANEVKKNFDNLVAKIVETRIKQEEERKARRATLPWYKRWFA